MKNNFKNYRTNLYSRFYGSLGIIMMALCVMVMTGTNLQAQSNALYIQSGVSVYVVGNNGTDPTLYVGGDLSTDGTFVDSVSAWTRLTGNLTNNGIFRADTTALEEFSATSGNQSILGSTMYSTTFGTLRRLQGSGVSIVPQVNIKVWKLDFGTNSGTINVGTYGKNLTVYNPAYNALSNYGQLTYVDVGTSGHLVRQTSDVTSGHYYEFPMGNSTLGYRNFGFNLSSLGGSGSNSISGSLNVTSGSLSYSNRYPTGFSGSGHTICVSGTNPQDIAFTCLSGPQWTFTGPTDYQYVVFADSSGCGSDVRRVIQAPMGTYDWNGNIGNVFGDSSSALCLYSDWTGAAKRSPGGPYVGLNRDFAVGGGSTVALPVKLIMFTAEPVDNAFIRTEWVTASEISNKGFHLMRSIDAVTWEQISFIATKAPDGNSESGFSYHYNDHAVVPNKVYYYKLVQEDLDGKQTSSNIVSANLSSSKIASMVCYPNPSSGMITLGINLKDASPVTIRITDMVGRLVYSEDLIISENAFQKMIHINESGQYQIQVMTSDEVFTQKVIILTK